MEDLVKGYGRDGNRLIDQLDKAHKEDYEQHITHAQNVGVKLVASFKSVQLGLDQTRKEIKGNRAQGIAKSLRTERQTLQSCLDEALLACT